MKKKTSWPKPIITPRYLTIFFYSNFLIHSPPSSLPAVWYDFPRNQVKSLLRLKKRLLLFIYLFFIVYVLFVISIVLKCGFFILHAIFVNLASVLLFIENKKIIICNFFTPSINRLIFLILSHSVFMYSNSKYFNDIGTDWTD